MSRDCIKVHAGHRVIANRYVAQRTASLEAHACVRHGTENLLVLSWHPRLSVYWLYSGSLQKRVRRRSVAGITAKRPCAGNDDRLLSVRTWRVAASAIVRGVASAGNIQTDGCTCARVLWTLQASVTWNL